MNPVDSTTPPFCYWVSQKVCSGFSGTSYYAAGRLPSLYLITIIANLRRALSRAPALAAPLISFTSQNNPFFNPFYR